MKTAHTYYSEKLVAYKQSTKAFYKQLSILSLTRISVFLATIIAVYWFWSNTLITIGLAVLGIVIFVILLNTYTKIKTQHLLHKALVQINEDELRIAQGDFHNRADGSEFQDPLHAYALDIDLFGRG